MHTGMLVVDTVACRQLAYYSSSSLSVRTDILVDAHAVSSSLGWLMRWHHTSSVWLTGVSVLWCSHPCIERTTSMSLSIGGVLPVLRNDTQG